MEQLRNRLSHIDFWYKLYADDLVIMVNHKSIEEVITVLKQVSTENSLIINPKKSAIMFVKNHKKMEN